MAHETFYRQFILTRDEGATQHRLTTWLPERGNGVTLEPGVTLRIGDVKSDELQPERWTVAEVGTTRRPESEVRKRAHNWTKYRQHTDV